MVQSIVGTLLDAQPEGAAFTQTAAAPHAVITHAAAAPLCADRKPLGKSRLDRNDVDDPQEGIGAVRDGIGAPHHLDALDVLERHWNQLPVHTAAKERRMQRTAIHQHLHAGRVVRVVGNAVVIDPRRLVAGREGLEAGHQAKHLMQRTCTRGTDHRAIDHRYRARGILQALRQAADRGHDRKCAEEHAVIRSADQGCRHSCRQQQAQRAPNHASALGETSAAHGVAAHGHAQGPALGSTNMLHVVSPNELPRTAPTSTHMQNALSPKSAGTR